MLTQRLTEGWTIMPARPAGTGTETWSARRPENAHVAMVPGIIQQVFPEHHGIAWYWCEFAAPELLDGERLLLTFEAVDYASTAWVNGTKVGEHEGGDTPFTLDITVASTHGPGNLLSLRVLNPTEERIDGMTLDEVPHGNKAAIDYWPGRSYNFGGILGEVRLQVVPEVRVEDLFVVASLDTGDITARVQISNDSDEVLPATLTLTVREDRSGIVAARLGTSVSLAPGPLETAMTVHVDDAQPWDLDDPFLYTLSATLMAGGRQIDERVIKSGFRTFCVKDGFFHLNGRRVYLRSTHTGNHYPLGQKVPPVAGFVRQDLVYAKAAGFNCVRFLSGLARPEQLGFCDEIGLLVYEEPAAGWCLGDSAEMVTRFDSSVRGMVLRDRNHPSVVIWGLLNETREGAVFRHAVESLALVRSLDASRLVLLSSGRWDADLSVGSLANPATDSWQHQWGSESSSPPADGLGDQKGPDKTAYVHGAGDLHFYPRLPESPEAAGILRSVGEISKPVFLSEYGVGSLFDAITEAADAARWVSGVIPPDLELTRSMARRFEEDWEAFGMESVYCFPQDALRASQAHQSRRRAVSFDLIRSNPSIAGYNLTGMLDHALTGEGSWTFWRRLKPGVAEALTDGWAPLRWCLFLRPTVVYPGDTISLELVLANEDALTPGHYPVTVAILGPDGRRRDQPGAVEIGAPESAGLAVPVLESGIVAERTPGVYECEASMGRRASPSAGRAAFHVVDRPVPEPLGVEPIGLGLDEVELSWLARMGMRCRANGEATEKGGLVVVGHPGAIDDHALSSLRRRIEDGATALVFCPWEWIPANEREIALPIGEGIVCAAFHDWLYHKDCFSKPHEMFDDLPSPGLMEWDYYGEVVPRHLLQGTRPMDVAAVAFAIGYPCPGGYASGVLAGTYRIGRGNLVVSCFDVLQHLGSSPVADLLVINHLRYAARKATEDGAR